jgi:hypothetical protein
MDAVVSLSEILHEVKRKKQSGVVLKIDFEKAYDKVNWHFLRYMMDKKSFGSTWCDWVMRTARGGKVAIQTNDVVGPYFTTHKGVRQGDPFSPLLFNLVADGLACLIHKAEMEDLFKVLFPILFRMAVVVFSTLMILFSSFKIVWKVLETLNSFFVFLNTCLV